MAVRMRVIKGAMAREVESAYLRGQIKHYFARLNPEVNPNSIDWRAYIDSTLTFEENIENLKRLFPVYRWTQEEKEKEKRPGVNEGYPLMRRWVDGTVEPPVFRHIRIPNPFRARRIRIVTRGFVPVRGFDTETTSSGDLYVLADDSSYLVNPSIEERLRFLTSRDALGFFFNIDFDFAAIFKPLFSTSDPVPGVDIRAHDSVLMLKLKDLGYTVRYIPGKYFFITTSKPNGKAKAKRRFDFYDVASFLTGSLDSLARKYLNEGKNDQDLGIVDKGHMEQYSADLVAQYCMHDALITRRLAEWLVGSVEDFAQKFVGVRVSPRHYISKASLAEFYALQSIPIALLRPILPPPVYDVAYGAYHGGLFDLWSRGRARVVILDINSAYPSVMRDLLPLKGEWRRVSDFDPDADYGFYMVHARYNGFMPFSVRGKVYYPVTRDAYPYIATQSEMTAYPELKKADVVDGWTLHVDSSARDLRPLARFINALFEMKRRAKKEKDNSTYWLAKVIMNSLYGKFAQTAGGRPGELFNPVWASEITARTRIKLYSMAQLIGMDYVVSFDTDSISFKEGAPVQKLQECGCLDPEELGYWDWKVPPDGPADLVYVQNGVVLSGDLKEFYHTRGFMKATLRDFTLAEDGIHVRFVRPVHIREALIREDLGPSSINRFLEFEKVISYESDKKMWARPFYPEGFEREIPGAAWGDTWLRDRLSVLMPDFYT